MKGRLAPALDIAEGARHLVILFRRHRSGAQAFVNRFSWDVRIKSEWRHGGEARTDKSDMRGWAICIGLGEANPTAKHLPLETCR